MSILELLFGEERGKELSRIYGFSKRPEVRLTAVGWKPDDSFKEDDKPTASGEQEFYKKESKDKNVRT